MTKMSVFVETTSGEVLAEVMSFKDKVSIGSGEECLICLKNRKVAELESEIYILNDECWLQVSKDGAPISFMGKQYRSIKITQSTQFQFRDLVLKVILDSIPEFEGEATKIVNETLLDNSEKTRLVMATDSPLALEFTRTQETRIDAVEPPDFEATRIITNVEKTNPEPIFETTRIVSMEKPKENIEIKESPRPQAHRPRVQSEGPRIDWPTLPSLKLDFGRASVYWQKILIQFHIKERIFPIVGVSFLVIAAAVFVLSSTGSTPIVSSQPQTTHNAPTVQAAEPATVAAEQSSGPSVSLEDATTQTKEEYLRELSSLFN